METKEVKQLEVGDKIYSRSRWGMGSIYTIERVTKTQAISGNQRFRREYRDPKRINAVGGGGAWNSTHYELENEQIKQAFYESQVRSKIRNINFEKLPLKTLEQILTLVNTENGKN